MKITLPPLSFNEKLDEFDFWVTPSLGDITKSLQYNETQSSICSLIEIIGETTNNFEKVEDFSSKKIGKSIIKHVNKLNANDRVSVLNSLAIFLFLVTGKSDNNCKCQFPLFLRDISRISSLPKINNIDKKKALVETDIPREIKSEKISKLVSDLKDFPVKQLELLTLYINFI